MNESDVFEFNEDLSNAEIVNNDSFLRLKTKNRHKEIRRKFFYFGVGIVVTFVICLICIVVFFGLKTVEIKGNSRYTEDEIRKASGFTSQDNLMALDFAEAKENIIRQCPYVSDVSFKVVLPSTLIITVIEDAPSYCAEIYGDYFLLSEDLRVISKHDLYEDILVLETPVIYLKLPEVKRAVAGEKLVFEKSSSMKHLNDLLQLLKNQTVFETINCIDASDRYHISLYAEGCRYKIDIGNSDNLDTKLKFVSKVIQQEFDQYSIVSFNVEKINEMVVLQKDKLFEFR